MGGFLKINKIFEFSKLKKPNVFVETGTYQPVMVNNQLRIPTIFKVSPHFKQLYTIEIEKNHISKFC